MTEPKSQPVRIVSDGTPMGTFIIVGDNEIHLKGVEAVSWSLDVRSQKPKVTLTLRRVSVDLVGEVEEE